MLKRLVLLVVLLAGCWAWYVFIWTPTPEEKKASSPPVAAGQPPQSHKEENQLSNQDQEEAEKVARLYLQIYFMEPRESAFDLARKLEPYVAESMLIELRKSMKVSPPVQIEDITLSPVQPPYIPGGVTYHAIVGTKQEEWDHWFSMMKIDGQWKVIREEEGLSGY
jgi:hypothetical protein